MPQVDIIASAGPATISYTISTPTSENASSVDPTLPIVVLLHPIYVGHIVFHFQYANPKLRRFNLIGLDARGHGETKGSIPPTYRRAEAAEDVFRFMEALRLPPCHVVGLSMGACVGLQLAVSHPDKVLSLFMISPLPLVEPDVVGAGRQEIYDCWADGWKDPSHHDKEALLDAVFGAVQLGFNGSDSSIVKAVTQQVLPHAFRNWDRDHLDELETISVKFFVDRKPHSISVLQQAKCRIHLVHCEGDIAYPREFVDELQSLLEEAGLDVKASQVDGAAHFGCVTHPVEINALLHDWIIDNTKGVVPPAKPSVISPFEKELVRLGYVPESSDDSEDDDVFLIG